jgi:hypothetical protein
MSSNPVVPWIGIGALVVAGYYIQCPATKEDVQAKNAKTGPPFYEAATSIPLRNTGFNSIRKNLKENAHNPYGNGPAEVQQFQELIRDESELARVRQWVKATDRQEGIIVMPNNRKITYVNKW